MRERIKTKISLEQMLDSIESLLEETEALQEETGEQAGTIDVFYECPSCRARVTLCDVEQTGDTPAELVCGKCETKMNVIGLFNSFYREEISKAFTESR